MNKLQAGIYIGTIFIVLIIVLIFWGVIPGLRQTDVSVALTFWGTEPKEVFDPAITAYERANRNSSIAYVRKDATTYEAELINAIATGRGPDMWIIPAGLLARNSDKLFPVPTILMTEREFKETYASIATNVFFQNGAILGIPLAIDPLVLFWNKDFFASDAIALPPRTWDEFLADATRLTKREANGNITRSGAAMGLSSNIPEAKDILSLLILQGGNGIIDIQTHDVVLDATQITDRVRVSPAESALRFYTDFAKREKASYSWNNTFSNPATAFAREELAMFVGYASNLPRIRAMNPRLNIGVSPVPQFRNAPLAIGYATSNALTVSLSSLNRTAAWQFAKFLASDEQARGITERLSLAPARLDLLQMGHETPAFSVLYESVLRARSWYDPAPERTADIFRIMIDSALADRNINAIVSEAATRLRALTHP